MIDIQMSRESLFRGFQWRSAQPCGALGEVTVRTKIDTCDNVDSLVITNTNPVYSFCSGSGWVCMYITSKGCMGNLCTLCSILLCTKTCSKICEVQFSTMIIVLPTQTIRKPWGELRHLAINPGFQISLSQRRLGE